MSVDLSKYDFEILIDKSGSMSKEDCPNGKSRWEYAREETEALARTCAKFDDDGITVTLFDGKFKTFEGTTPEKVEDIFTENSPGGTTETGSVLENRLNAYFARKKAGTAKPVIMVVVTDGEPNDQKHVEKVLVNAANKVDSEEELGVSFFQVGNDPGATKFLKHLDDELQGNGAKFDIVDVKTFSELEDTSIVDALLAALYD